jgi:predicted NBD/HSP70 family sugar kinase/DNA-binding MarR family transcriptional regulator
MEPWHRLIRDKQQEREKILKEKSRKGTDQHRVRESNRSLVLNYIRERNTVPRSDLAPYTGLSRTAIGNIVDELVKEGIVVQEEHRMGEDRRTTLLSFNAAAGYVLGGTLGRQHLTVLLADLSGQPRQHLEIPFSISNGPEEGLPLLEKLLKVFVAQQQISWEMIVGIGLGIISPLALLPQKTALPAAFSRWANVDIQQTLQNDLGVPVYLDNDGNMGALGESRYGAGRNEGNMVYVKVGSGISGGLILHHEIYRGYAGTAGEIGHIPVDLNGHLCQCGRSGCLETVAGKNGILLEVQRFFPTLTTLPQVIEAAREGDVACIGALARAGRYLGFVLAGLVNTLNPSLIVLDGSTMQAGELILNSLRAAIETHSLPASLAHTRIILAECNGLAMPLGSVATILDAIFA